MGVVQDTIADGIGQRGMPQVVMPQGRRELAGDDGRPEVIAILEDLEEILPVLVSNRRQPPVIEHKDVGPREPDQEPGIGPRGACQCELME